MNCCIGTRNGPFQAGLPYHPAAAL
jgi:hypothetical protein